MPVSVGMLITGANTCEGLGRKTFKTVKQITARGSWLRQNSTQRGPPGIGGGNVVSGAGRESAASPPSSPYFLGLRLFPLRELCLQSSPVQKPSLDPTAYRYFSL